MCKEAKKRRKNCRKKINKSKPNALMNPQSCESIGLCVRGEKCSIVSTETDYTEYIIGHSGTLKV